jgi:hypothetical protein
VLLAFALTATTTLHWDQPIGASVVGNSSSPNGLGLLLSKTRFHRDHTPCRSKKEAVSSSWKLFYCWEIIAPGAKALRVHN